MVDIAVIGSNGMLGSKFVQKLSRAESSFIGLDLAEIDITNPDTYTVLKENMPRIIVNCAAYTAVDQAEAESEKAFSINAQGPAKLAEFCKGNNILLVHYSTDYVFNGQKAEGYSELDACDPINVYGASKYAGETNIQRIMDNQGYLILRTAWLYGEGGKNFVTTITRLAGSQNVIKIVSDQRGCPTYTGDLVDWTLALIKNNCRGLYHAVNSGNCSWYEFAKEIVKKTKSNCSVEPILAKDYVTKATRPSFSILNNQKLSSDINYTPRKWQEALSEYPMSL